MSPVEHVMPGSVAEAAVPPLAAARSRPLSATARRVIGAVVALAAAAVLSVATLLTPAAEGLGTHEQLSLPACGWVSIADLPCPTCGMTTAFAHAADGNLLASFRTQPLGCLLALLTAMALLLGSYVAVTGSTVLGMVARTFTARVAWTFAAIALIAWAYKVASHKGWI